MHSHKKALPFQRVLSGFLRVSTFYKILIANTFLVFLSLVVFLRFYELYSGARPWTVFVLLILFCVTVGSILVNIFLIRVALSPLQELSNTMKEVANGNLAIRAREHPLAGEMLHCTETLNQMLEMLQGNIASLEGEKDRSKRYSEQVIKVQEEERKRIARELHDETGQILASLILGLEKVKRTMPEIFPQCVRCREDVSSLMGLTDKALVELHRIAFNLRPSLLDDMGLKDAIGELLRIQLESKGIYVSFVWKGSEQKFLPQMEIALFRIVQEAITNILKYADAVHVSVLLKLGSGKVSLFIADDGVGFNVKSMSQGKDNHFGVVGMQERVAILGGKFQLRSISGKGTAIRISIPLLNSHGADYFKQKTGSLVS